MILWQNYTELVDILKDFHENDFGYVPEGTVALFFGKSVWVSNFKFFSGRFFIISF